MIGTLLSTRTCLHICALAATRNNSKQSSRSHNGDGRKTAATAKPARHSYRVEGLESNAQGLASNGCLRSTLESRCGIHGNSTSCCAKIAARNARVVEGVGSGSFNANLAHRSGNMLESPAADKASVCSAQEDTNRIHYSCNSVMAGVGRSFPEICFTLRMWHKISKDKRNIYIYIYILLWVSPNIYILLWVSPNSLVFFLVLYLVGW